MPKVSVIVPIYKVEPFIERCARSLFEQTLDDIEYIFVNDCTPDKSMEVLSRVLEDYPGRKEQVRIITMPVNGGQAKVRKVGIEAAIGDYIIHCDSDDWVDRTMYEKMWRKAVEGDYDMVLSGFYRTDGEGKDTPVKISWSGGSSVCADLLTDRIECFTWNKLVKREMYGYITAYPKDNMMEDVALILPLAFHCKSFGLVDEALYYYFTRPDGISQQTVTIDKVRQIERNFQLAIDHIRQNSPAGTYGRELLHMRCKVRIQAFPLKWREYMKVCPDVLFSLPFDRYMPVKDRLGHISKCLGIHDILRK